MRKVRNVTRPWDNATKDRKASKDHNQIFCLYRKKIEKDRAIWETHGKSHFNGKYCSRSPQNRSSRGKNATTYSCKNPCGKIKRQKSPWPKHPFNLTSKHPKTQHIKYQMPGICCAMQKHIGKKLP